MSIRSAFTILVCVLFGTSCSQQQHVPLSESTEARARMASEMPPAELTRVMNDATDAYRRFLEQKPDSVPTARLRDEAACVAVVPKFTSTALVVGVSGGQGVVTCKMKGAGSPWSAPSFFTIRNTSLGAQLGSDTSSVIAYVIGDDAGQKFAEGDTFKIGSDIGATAGTVSGNLAASSRSMQTYAINRSGMFLGVSLSGSAITPDRAANEEYYGRSLTPRQILSENTAKVTPDATRFIGLLPA